MRMPLVQKGSLLLGGGAPPARVRGPSSKERRPSLEEGASPPWRREPLLRRESLLIEGGGASSKGEGPLLQRGVPPCKRGPSSLEEGASPPKGAPLPWRRGASSKVQGQAFL